MTTGGSSNDWADPTDYLTGFHFAPIHQQSCKLVDRVFEIHSQTMPGVTRERADAGYLETASKLPLYGVSAARVIQDMMIGVSATGITVFRGRQILNRFPWPKVTKLSYKGDQFIMRLRRNAGEKSDTSIAFTLCDEPSDFGTTGARRYGTTGAGRFWRICTEHHCFFRFESSDAFRRNKFRRRRRAYVKRTFNETLTAARTLFGGSESENEFAASDVEIVGDEVTHPSVGDRERSGATSQREGEREENCVGATTRLESEEEEPPQGFEHYQSKDVRVEQVEGMTLELDAGVGEDGEGGKDVLVTSNATQKITEVVTITVEKTGGAAVDVAFLTPDVIERASALVVTHGAPTQESATAAQEGREIAITDMETFFED